jgi:hypothetical protein
MSRYNYFRNQLVDGYAFPARPQTTFNFLSRGFSFVNLGASSTLEYSFDGYNVHGNLVAGSSYAGLVFDNRLEDRVWWRRGATSPATTVRVEAWGEWGRVN